MEKRYYYFTYGIGEMAFHVKTTMEYTAYDMNAILTDKDIIFIEVMLRDQKIYLRNSAIVTFSVNL